MQAEQFVKLVKGVIVSPLQFLYWIKLAMRYKQNSEADALYIWLSDKPYGYGEDLDRERRVDYAPDGTPIGVELLCVSGGVSLRELPQPEAIAQVLRELRIKLLV